MPSKKKPDTLEVGLQRIVDERIEASKWSAVFSLRDTLHGMADRQNIIEGRIESLEALILLTNTNNLMGQQVIVSQLNAICRKAGLNDAVQDMEIHTGDECGPEEDED